MGFSVEKYLNTKYLSEGVLPARVLPALAVSLVVVANLLVFTVVPNERVMGAVQRIFYFHVGSALAAWLMIAALFLGSIFYLATRKPEWDLLAQAGASVGFAVCSIVLATGMIWAQSAWNTFWRWEPRLVSFLVIWLILLSYSLLRSFTARGSGQRNVSAVLGILAAVNVPIVVFSVKLLDHREQLHPQVIANQGLSEPSYIFTLIVAICAMAALALWLLVLKAGNLSLEQRIEHAEREQGY